MVFRTVHSGSQESRRSWASVKYSLSVHPSISKHADMAGLAASRVPAANAAATSFGVTGVIRVILHLGLEGSGSPYRLLGRGGRRRNDRNHNRLAGARRIPGRWTQSIPW